MTAPSGYLHVRRIHGHFWRPKWRKRYFMLDPGRRSMFYYRDALTAIKSGSFSRLFAYLTPATTVEARANPEGGDHPWIIVLDDRPDGDTGASRYVELGAASEAEATKWAAAIQAAIDLAKRADGDDGGGDDGDGADAGASDDEDAGGGDIASFARDGFPALVAAVREHVAKDQTPAAHAVIDRGARALARFEARRGALGAAGAAALDRVAAAWNDDGSSTNGTDTRAEGGGGDGSPAAAATLEPLGALRARVAAEMVVIRANLAELETNAGWDVVTRAKPGTRGGVSVFTKKLHEEDSFDSLKLDTTIEADLVRLASVIAEGDLTPQWVPFCARARMLCKPSILHGLVHMFLEFPFVMRPFISNRDLVLEGKGVDIMDRNKVLLTLRSVAESPHCAVPEAGAGGYVRISNHGAFLFNVVTETTVRMRCIFNMDLKLPVQPPIIVNFINRKFGPQLVGFITKILRKYERTPFAARVRENRALYGEIEARVAAYFAQRAAAAEAAAAGGGTPPRRRRRKGDAQAVAAAAADATPGPADVTPVPASAEADTDDPAVLRHTGLKAWLHKERSGSAGGEAAGGGFGGTGVVVAVAFLAMCIGAAMQAHGNAGEMLASLLPGQEQQAVEDRQPQQRAWGSPTQNQQQEGSVLSRDGFVMLTPAVWFLVIGMAFCSGYLMAMSVRPVR